MTFRKYFVLLFILMTTGLIAEESAVNFKLYGFVRNDIFYNSRQNVEAIDGAFHLFPKPIELVAGKDKNAVPQAEMLSVATRLGLDISGNTILGAKSSAKIEMDFAGFSQNYYVIRLRQAYAKLNWNSTELLNG